MSSKPNRRIIAFSNFSGVVCAGRYSAAIDQVQVQVQVQDRSSSHLLRDRSNSEAREG